MKRDRIKLTALGAGCTLCLIGLIVANLLSGLGNFLLLPTNPDPWMEMARSRVRIGDKRDDALQALSDAWFHTECRVVNSTTIRDLFFYGPHDRDRVEVVLVVSREKNDRTIVTFIGGVENYMLHLYNYCIPPVSQAFKESIVTPVATP